MKIATSRLVGYFTMRFNQIGSSDIVGGRS
ncbi:uncharacterized protein METZ01_LOCUS345372 [marine metagenome]|uniref:Uncharacterized protein n=1 Tax=marine metagenome TaxID=408172 RepID=A0A382R665_9ZZZZ